jgi:hypothetical protein
MVYYLVSVVGAQGALVWGVCFERGTKFNLCQGWRLSCSLFGGVLLRECDWYTYWAEEEQKFHTLNELETWLGYDSLV